VRYKEYYYNIRMNQLFKIIPPKELVDGLLEQLGIVNFNENYKFSREDIENKNFINKLLEVPFEDYYINCKYQKYFEKVDEKKCITILRQLLRLYGYKIKSSEKFSNGHKFLLYQLEKIIVPEVVNKNILVFD
jgi:hypothetical protein